MNPWNCFHRHNEVELCFFTGGTVVYRFGGSTIGVPPETALLFWGSIPHQLIETAPETWQYWITIPINQFLEWELPEEIVRRVLNGEMLKETAGDHKRTDLNNFMYLNRLIESAEVDERKIIELMIETRVRQFIRCVSSQEGAGAGHSKNLPIRDRSVFSDLYGLIVESFKKPVGVRHFAEKLKINPNYASTIFKEKCGISIIDFMTMLRIYEAQKLLITTERKIIDIALDAGFKSLSNFYLAFNRICGKSPSDYRRSIR